MGPLALVLPLRYSEFRNIGLSAVNRPFWPIFGRQNRSPGRAKGLEARGGRQWSTDYRHKSERLNPDEHALHWTDHVRTSCGQTSPPARSVRSPPMSSSALSKTCKSGQADPGRAEPTATIERRFLLKRPSSQNGSCGLAKSKTPKIRAQGYCSVARIAPQGQST